jgi:hypothetical protein
MRDVERRERARTVVSCGGMRWNGRDIPRVRGRKNAETKALNIVEGFISSSSMQLLSME